MEIPPIRLERWSGLWEQLPKPVVSEQPQCFEALGQTQGFVLYRTQIPAGVSGKLSIPMHGYPTVYVEGVLEKKLDIPAPDKAATLEILVQAMGHINFLIEMDGDRKGLLGMVKIGDTVLKNWEMFCFPLRSGWVMSLTKTAPAPGRVGGIFKGEFELGTVADTYLDMSKYRKGMLWVNGRNLGYHWSARGPQYRLYCPGPWLKKGANTIMVLDIELSEPQPVAGTGTAH